MQSCSHGIMGIPFRAPFGNPARNGGVRLIPIWILSSFTLSIAVAAWHSFVCFALHLKLVSGQCPCYSTSIPVSVSVYRLRPWTSPPQTRLRLSSAGAWTPRGL